jgi:hypothetical protein
MPPARRTPQRRSSTRALGKALALPAALLVVAFSAQVAVTTGPAAAATARSNHGRTVDLSARGTCNFTTFPGNQYTTDVGTSFPRRSRAERRS